MTVFPDIHTHVENGVAGAFRLVCRPPEGFVPLGGHCYSVGIHPWSLAGDMPAECVWQMLSDAVCLPQVWAVGEAGLDKLAAAPMSLQEEVFVRQTLLAERAGKPLVIHLVKAVDELLRVRHRLSPGVPWIIHGFRGKAPMAKELVRHGFYLSFGPCFQEPALCAVPLSRLFLETDESPVPLAEVYLRAARARRISVDELADAVRANVRSVFLAGIR